MGYTRETETTVSGAQSSETKVVGGDGTDVSTTVTKPVASTELKTASSYWSMSNISTFGIHIELPREASLDISMDGVNLFDFSSLTAQLIIPLN